MTNDCSEEILDLTANLSNDCEICGEPAIGWNYGAIVCGSCKIFFIRATTSAAPIPKCQNAERCVPPKFFCDKAGKVKCISCRYKRALRAGMDPERPARRRGCFLRERRAQVGLKPRGRPKNGEILKKPCTSGNIGLKELQIAAQSFSAPVFVGPCDSVETIRNLLNLESLISNDDLAKSIVLDYTYSLDVSITDVLANPGVLCQRVPMGIDGSNPPKIPENCLATLGGRLCARLSMHCADWCRGIPEFWNLHEEDRINLFARLIGQLGPFTDYFMTYKHSFTGGLLTTFGSHAKIDELHILDEFKETFYFHIYYGLNTVIPMMKRTEIRDEEFLLLKAIILFSSDIGFREISSQVTRKAFYKYTMILLEHLKIRFKDEKVALVKFNELMMIPMCMQTVAAKLQSQFGQVFLTKQAGVEGKFPEEIFFKT
ncbi:unnamed protein product, partial [Mesorhabditis belari]|uniref:Uncharacterized protein n=1 Tax=Mesorhabditis belari TaxID=2138241 RepID=A0AAF3EE89_9BILA